MAYIGQSPAPQALVASDITDGIISNAKLAQDIISADTALGAEPADTDELLISDAGVLKRMDYSHIKGGGGKLGQMVSVQLAVEQSTTSSTFVAITGVTGAITPAATSSKVWIQGTLLWGRANNNTMWMQMFRGSTLINQQTFSSASETDSFYASGTNSGYYVLRQAPFSFLDSPSTSSEETYTIKWRSDGNTLYLNRIGADTNQAGTSQLNLIEILA